MYATSPAPQRPQDARRQPPRGYRGVEAPFNQPFFHTACSTTHRFSDACPAAQVGARSGPAARPTPPAQPQGGGQTRQAMIVHEFSKSSDTSAYPPLQCLAMPVSFGPPVTRASARLAGQAPQDAAPARPEASSPSHHAPAQPPAITSEGSPDVSTEMAQLTLPISALTQQDFELLRYRHDGSTVTFTLPAATARALLLRTDVLLPDSPTAPAGAEEPMVAAIAHEPDAAMYCIDPDYVEVHCNNRTAHPARLVIDTASEVCAISQEFADAHGFQSYVPTHPTVIQTALGEKGQVTKEVRGQMYCILNASSAQEGTTWSAAGTKFLIMPGAPMYDVLLGVSGIKDLGGMPDATTGQFLYRPHLRQGDPSTFASVPMICTGRRSAALSHATVACMVTASAPARAPDASFAVQARATRINAQCTPKPERRERAPSSPASSKTQVPSSRKGWVWGVLAALFGMLLCFTCMSYAPPPHIPAVKVCAMVRVQDHGHKVLSVLPGGPESVAMGAGYVKDPDLGVIWGNHPDMSPDEQTELQAIVRDRKASAFAYDAEGLGCYNGPVGPFSIPLTDEETPILSHKRPKSKAEREIIDEKAGELLKAGIIKPTPVGCKCVSETVQPSKKDADGNHTDKRMCIDLRKINTATERDIYGMHVPDALFRELQGSHFFTKIDLRAGYHQIPIVPKDQGKTTFYWANKLFMFVRMPLGARNATAHFQRVMDAEILSNGLTGIACSFVDDILVYSKTAQNHIKHVQRALDMLIGCNLKAHPDKTIVGASSVEFLGFQVSAYGILPEEAKVQAIRALRAPTNLSELRSIMGFVNYYRCFVPNFSALAQPINALTGKDVPWVWGPEQQQAFDAIKNELCTPGKAIKHIDPDRPLILHSDWSKCGIGAVLGQKDADGNEYMVACISRSLNAGEKNYVSYQGEMLAAVWAIKSFHVFLHGVPFTLVTDHQPLTWLMRKQDLTGMHARWVLCLQPYDFTIVHRPGIKHQNADCLSRFPAYDTTDLTCARLLDESQSVALMLALNASEHTAMQLSLIDTLPPRSTTTYLDIDPMLTPGEGDCVLPTPEPGPAASLLCILASRGGGYEPPYTPFCAFTTRSAQLPLTQLQDTAAELQDMADTYHGWSDEVHEDSAVIGYVMSGELSADVSACEKKRILRRAKSYSQKDGALMRVMPDGESKVVPVVADREAIVAHVHEGCGHYGVNRTLSLLLPYYWWRGMKKDVSAFVKGCQVCDISNTAFNVSAKVLSPLPIRGMFYRWGVDLAGPFNPTSTRGNKFVMIMVEHFSKLIVVVPLPDKQATTTASVFLEHVLSRFGCCAEVVTDQGTEFAAEFEGLLRSQFIDHRTTSANHPQADGLAERAVQTIKRAIRKYVESTKKPEAWDACLPWIALGYNCSKQASSKFSPYFLMFARHPLIPSNHSRAFEVPLELTDSDAATQGALDRAQVAQAAGVMAMENLQIAQHRDTLRYACIRGGGYLPLLREFSVGDFVYVRKGNLDSVLQFKAKNHILRVKSVKSNGTIELQGKCTHTMITNVVNCAPCHLPDLEGTMDPTLSRPHAYLACEVCRFMDQEDIMVLCDACNSGYHTICLSPPLASVPKGIIWLCPTCIGNKVTERDVMNARASSRLNKEMPEDGPVLNGAHVPLFRDATARRKKQEAASLHDCVIRDPFHARSKAQQQQQRLGRVKFLGHEQGLKCLRVDFADGAQALMSATEVRHRQMPTGTTF